MIMRFWLLGGSALVVLAWLLTVPWSPEPMQGTADSLLGEYRDRGLLPSGELAMSTRIGHEVFEVPAEDALHAGDSGGMSMPGMSMGSGSGGGEGAMPMPGMSMGGGEEDKGGTSMPGMSMGGGQEDKGGTSMPGMSMGGSEEDKGGTSMPGMSMGGSEEDKGGTSMPGMPMGAGEEDKGGTSMPGMSMGRGEEDKGGRSMPGMPKGGDEDDKGAMTMPGMAMEPGAAPDGDHETKAPAMPMDHGSRGGGDAKSAPPMPMEQGSGAGMPAMPAERGSGDQAMPGMAMNQGAAEGGGAGGHGSMAMPQTGMAGAPAATAPSVDHAAEAPMPAHGAPGAASGAMPMPGLAEAGHGAEGEEGEGHAGGAGLAILPDGAPADRTVRIDMAEWGFQPANLTVRPGEVVRFEVHNTGTLPHEFMFMPPEGMNAVQYRIERADWSLTEHEALFERAVVLPGDGFEVTVRIEQPGAWMYMCMFPYHMRFGMMGMMMTEGMSMDMGHGDMKM